MRTTRLNRKMIAAIADMVGQGAYPYIAALSLGIPKSTFYAWMHDGENSNSGLKRELRDKVQEAQAKARTDAENRVFDKKPLEWLRLGPGREREGERGWTEAPQTLHIEGEVSHQHEHTTRQGRPGVSPATLVDALVELKNAGLIEFNEHTEAMLQADREQKGLSGPVLDEDGHELDIDPDVLADLESDE